jgi:hypothetical protein
VVDQVERAFEKSTKLEKAAKIADAKVAQGTEDLEAP